MDPFFRNTLCVLNAIIFFVRGGNRRNYNRCHAGRVSTLPTRLRIGGSAAGSESGIKQSITAGRLPFQVFPTRSTRNPRLKLNAKRPIKAYNDWYEHGNANVLSLSQRWRRPLWRAANDGQVKEVANVGWFRRLMWHTRHRPLFFFHFWSSAPAPLSARFSNPRFFCYFFLFFFSPASLVPTRIFFATTRGNWTRQPRESERTGSTAIIGAYVRTKGWSI